MTSARAPAVRLFACSATSNLGAWLGELPAVRAAPGGQLPARVTRHSVWLAAGPRAHLWAGGATGGQGAGMLAATLIPDVGAQRAGQADRQPRWGLAWLMGLPRQVATCLER